MLGEQYIWRPGKTLRWIGASLCSNASDPSRNPLNHQNEAPNLRNNLKLAGPRRRRAQDQPIPKWGRPTWVVLCLHMATVNAKHMFLKNIRPCECRNQIGGIHVVKQKKPLIMQFAIMDEWRYYALPLVTNFSAGFNLCSNRFLKYFRKAIWPYILGWSSPDIVLIIWILAIVGQVSRQMALKDGLRVKCRQRGKPPCQEDTVVH